MKNCTRAFVAAAFALTIANLALAGSGESTGLPPDRITGIWDLLLRTLGL